MFVTIPAEESQQLIIVIKSPLKAQILDLLTFINIVELDEGGSPIFNIVQTEKRVEKGFISSSEVEKSKVLKVMLLGKLENPALICPKGIRDVESGQTIIPLVAKLGQQTIKYKLPFKI